MKSNLEELLEHVPQTFTQSSNPFNEIKLGLLLDSIIAKTDKKEVIKKLRHVINENVYESVEDLVNYLVMTMSFDGDKRIGLFQTVSFVEHEVEFQSIDSFSQYYEAAHYFKNCLRTVGNFEDYTINMQLMTVKKNNKFIGLLSVIPKFPGHLEISLPLGFKNEEVKGAKTYQATVIEHFKSLGFNAKPEKKEDLQQIRQQRRNMMRRN